MSEPRPKVAVGDLLGPDAPHLHLTLRAGKRGLGHEILLARVQRPGLALTGYTDYIRYGRVQIMGGSEINYLQKLTPRKRAAIVERLVRCQVSCFIVTKGLSPPRELVRAAERQGIPLLTTPNDSTPFIKHLSSFLEARLAERVHLHSVLMDVFGLGVLILGESGIGKSECALDLVDRGHRLVADDVVEVRRMTDALVGDAPDLTRHHMEIRGLGVLNIKDLYGVSAIRTSKRVELAVQLERWEQGKEYDRLGIREESYPILGVALPLIRMPVAPGRNLAILVEVAARNQLLKERGYHSAARFAERVDALMADPLRRAPESLRPRRVAPAARRSRSRARRG
ncbi:MAG TPA: HPr(Ser) kinase/phosphatase [Vicinamibacteria bacterium]